MLSWLRRDGIALPGGALYPAVPIRRGTSPRKERPHLLLCEADPPTAVEIHHWLSGLDERTTSFELHRGDWRKLFAGSIPTDCNAHYFSLDPNMYDRHDVRSPKPENVYSGDIDLLLAAVGYVSAMPTVVQLSTYSSNGANSQSDVFESLVPRFTSLGLSVTYVRADNSMMSFIFSRGVAVPPDLEARFRAWLTKARAAA